MVGGYDSSNDLSSVELFPPPPSDCCSIPDLPQGRFGHSLSLLSGGRLVVCGGRDASGNILNSCISWVAGNTSWIPLYTMRWLTIIKENTSLHYHIVVWICFSFCIQCLSISTKMSTNNNSSESSSLSNTITARRELVTRPGRRLLFPTPSSSLAALAVQSSLQRLCQVNNTITDGGSTAPLYC